MYYKKNKSIIRSIKNNKNNKAYYALIVVLMAAIGIIAASAMLNNMPGDKNNGHSEGNIATPSGDISQITTSQTIEDMAASTGGDLTETVVGTENNDAAGSGMDNNGTAGSGTNNGSDLDGSDIAVYIFTNDKLMIVCEKDENNEYSLIRAVTQCCIGPDVYALLQKNKVAYVPGDGTEYHKSMWNNQKYDETTYYVQYYSEISGISFHSALYKENGNNASIVSESYETIGKSDRYISSGKCITANGVTLTVKSAKWFYENVPGLSDIYICRDINSSGVTAIQELHSRGKTAENLIEKDYMINQMLFAIPAGFHTDPTDANAVGNYCPFRLGEIKEMQDVSIKTEENPHPEPKYELGEIVDKKFEIGEIVYSDKQNLKKLLENTFNGVVLYSADNEDISQYVVKEAMLDDYSKEEFDALNYKGFLTVGRYPVLITAADIFGNVISKVAYVNIVDTTPPVIQLSREITEINRAQMEFPDYIFGMVTVTDLCKPEQENLTYTMEEDREMVTIRFFATDIFGNIGTLEVVLRNIDY